jgi:hypothetical protein
VFVLVLQHLVKLSLGAYAPGVPNVACRRSRAELLRVVLPAPAISLELSLWRRGEQLGIEELVPEPPVERLGKAVLPWRSRRDVSRTGCVAGLAPIP